MTQREKIIEDDLCGDTLKHYLCILAQGTLRTSVKIEAHVEHLKYCLECRRGIQNAGYDISRIMPAIIN